MAETTRTRQLRKLAANLPNANQQVASGLQSARQAQLQETIKQAKPTAGPQAAQAIGAQQAAQSGAINLQQQQANQAQAAQLGQMGARAMEQDTAERLGQEKRGLSKRAMQNANKLAQIDRDAKNELLDKQLEFQRDEAGRAVLNERQLADLAIISAQNEEQLRDFMQSSQQVHQRKIQMYEAAANRLKQVLKQGYISKNQKLDQESKARIIAARIAAEKKAQKAKADAANKAGMMRAIGTIGGGAVGAFGGPTGAAAGANIGGTILGALGGGK